MDNKKFLESKKATGLLIGIGSIIGAAGLSVAMGGIAAGAALPMVMDGIKWLVLGYFGAQGGADIVNTVKTARTGSEETKSE